MGSLKALPVMTPRPPGPIVVGGTYWTVNGVNVFSANLVRGLNQRGGDARVLLTEEDTDLITVRETRMPRPDDIPFETLGLRRFDEWGRHWGRMVRYLTERAPCVYIPNSDWRHSCVGPQLPNDVAVVGVVHSDDPLHYDHVRRLGHTWNIVACVSRAVAERTAALCPALEDRIITIPIGVPIPQSAPEPRRRGDRLRLIYHGVLKQHQKRVLDLPLIVQAAVDRGVPVEMTIAGAGPDEAALRAASASLVERGLIRFPGVTAPTDVGPLLAQHDVYVLASEFEGMPNALIEAMGRGCVPLATQMKSGVPELVRDGHNGFLVPIGDAAAFAERLHVLWTDQTLARRLAEEAFITVSTGRYRVDDMVESYAAAFDRARDEAASRQFVREVGELSHPPAEVAGVSLFPVALDYHEPGVGRFPTEDDALDYQQELRAIGTTSPSSVATDDARPSRARPDGVRVFISCPTWVDNGPNRWAEDLARGLRAEGVDARLLLTEESTSLVQISTPRLDRPTDIPVLELQPTGQDNWGGRWGAMIRLLEDAAPCVYLPNYDWRHSCITPLLSSQIMVVGCVHAADPFYLEHLHRLGGSWNAIVATNRTAMRRSRRTEGDLEDRLAMIPHGMAIPPVAPPPRADVRVILLVGAGGVRDEVELAGQLAAAGALPTVVLCDEAINLADACRTAGADVLVRPNRQQWLDLCRACGVIVVAMTDGEAERLTVEAMAHGCVPVFVGPGADAFVSGLAVDASALVVGNGVVQVIEAVERLKSDAGLRNQMSQRARTAAATGRYTTDQMVAAFLDLFSHIRADVDRGLGPERAGRLQPPPKEVDGANILPVEMTFDTTFGRFPTQADATSFEAERGVGSARGMLARFLTFFTGTR